MTEKEFINIATTFRQQAQKTALGMGLDKDEAEDIAQDVMLKLWAIKNDLPSSPSIGMVATITKHLCIDLFRKRRTIPLNEGISVADDLYSSPHNKMESEEYEEWIKQKLKGLPNTQYQVLHLRQIEQKDNQEIADILGINISSVPTLLCRARQTLLEEIKKKRNMLNKGGLEYV